MLAIDSGDISIGKAVAKENGVSHHIEFIQADLSDFELPGNDRVNVLLGMLYFNDPRRDFAQAELTSKLRSRLLRPGGIQIPNRVVYTGCPLEWPEQDIHTRLSDVDKKIDVMEQKYGITLATLRETSKHFPDPAWFPSRRSSGLLARDRARLLSGGKDVFVEIDYEAGFQGYPEQFQCRITQPGICNVLLFTQALFAGPRAIFFNESISWVRNPLFVEPGTDVQFALDKSWLGGSILSMARV